MGDDWTARTHRQPSPTEMLQLVTTHGYEAAKERWWYIRTRTFSERLETARKTLQRRSKTT